MSGQKWTIVFVWLLLAAPFLPGQSNANKGSISGTVLDSGGAAVPGALVLAENIRTGARRETHTNDSGYYRFAAVDEGFYRVSVDMSSMVVAVKSVAVDVGASVDVEMRLAMQKSVETVDVDAGSAITTDAAANQLFPTEVIRDLPIDGRRFQEFAALGPAAQSDAATRNQLSFVGQRGVYGNVMVDGTDYNEPFLGGIRGSERAMFAFTIPQSAVEEFQVITNGYSAEYGRSTGGILNAITRSGSNSLHGETFYQLRSKQLSATNPFGQSPLESQQQFGGSAGGPIRANRLFWFGAAEGQVADLPRTIRFAALDSVANNVTPAIQPAYDYFRSMEGPFHQNNNAVAIVGKLDYQFQDASRLTLRVNGSNNRAANAAATEDSWLAQTSNALSNNGTEEDSIRTAGAQWTAILPNLLLNDLRFSYSAEGRATKANSASPTVEAGVIGSFGTGMGLPLKTSDSRLQIADSVTMQKGQHSFSAGADYGLLQVGHRSGMNQYGTFVISGSDVASMLAILSNSGGPGGNRFDDPSVTYLRQVGNATIDTQAHQLAFFGQDQWRLSPTLSLSYGVRWEGQWNPSPDTSNSFLVSNVRGYPFPLGALDPTRIRSQFQQWAPRASLAWNLDGSGKTVLRVGTGLFYGQTPLVFYANALNNFGAAGGDLSLQIAPMGGQTVYQQFAAAGFDLNRSPLNQLPVMSVGDVWSQIAGRPNQFAQANVYTTSGNNFQNPRSLQVSAGLEHRMSRGLVFAYQFDQLNTVHLPRVVDFNVPPPSVRPGDLSLRPFFGLRSGTPRPNPNLGAVDVLDSSARSGYQGHSFRVQYRSGPIQFMGQYTLSFTRSDDDLEWPFIAPTYQNPFDFKQEWNWSAMDARHQASGYAVWQAPKGFEVTGLFSIRSGLPIDATTGSDTSELLSGNIGNRPLERPGVPFPRNAFRNLGYRGVSARLLKSIALKESVKLQLSVEGFNLFNFKNLAFTSAYDDPNNPAFIYGLGVGTNGQTIPANPGFLQQRTAQGYLNPAAVSQQGSPRQAQLGIRLLF